MKLGLTLLVVFVFLFFAAGFVLVRLIRAAGFYRKFVTICPETMKAATLDVAPGRGALEALFGEPRLQLVHCSLWPERPNCGQPCRIEMEAEPDASVPDPELCD
jgi:hypothetical protein